MTRSLALALAFAFVALGCAHGGPDPAVAQARVLFDEGRWEDGLAQLDMLARAEPRNLQHRTALIEARARAVNALLRQALAEREVGRFSQAEALYRRVLRIEADESRAVAGLEQVVADRRRHALLAEAEQAFAKNDLAHAEAKVRQVLLEAPRHPGAVALQRKLDEKKPRPGTPPALSAAMKTPISLDFRDANLKMIFDVMSRASGINFILDKDIRPDAKASIFVKATPLDQALESLLSTNQLARKVVNETTLVVYPNTPQKQKEYQELVIRNFYLTSADPKQMQTLLRTILKATDVFIDEKRNVLVMRDTPEAIQLAERLIAAHDQAEPEVMLEVEILEVGRVKDSEIGVELPDRVALGVADPITVRALRDLNSGGVNVEGLRTLVGVNLRKLFSDVNLLANPRIRVRNKEKARIHVGDRVPVISSSVSTTTAITTQSVSYLDVGLKLEVEPQVLEDDVVMKVNLEVSSIGREVIVQQSIAYQVGTRNAATTLTLKDGETQVLAGLITDNERDNVRRFPGLGELPVLGRLFSSRGTHAEKTEIILSITPRIVRRLARPEAALTEYASGVEMNIRSGAGAVPAAAPGMVPGAPGGPQPGGIGRSLGRQGQAPGMAAPPAIAAPPVPGAPVLVPAPVPVPPAPGVSPAPPQAPVAPAPPPAPGQAPPFIFQPPPGAGS